MLEMVAKKGDPRRQAITELWIRLVGYIWKRGWRGEDLYSTYPIPGRFARSGPKGMLSGVGPEKMGRVLRRKVIGEEMCDFKKR